MSRVPTAPGQEVFPGAQTTLPQSNALAARTGAVIEQSGNAIADILFGKGTHHG